MKLLILALASTSLGCACFPPAEPPFRPRGAMGVERRAPAPAVQWCGLTVRW
jgi:hypothetical protein